jgi:succinate dehydrogenase / fumarate reductase, cytochrome b subunit
MLPTSSIARKLLMALTGQALVLFVIIHAAGNSTIFFSKLNAYAAGLKALPLLLWAFRAFMFAVAALHIYLGIVLTLEDRNARPQGYAVSKHLRATFAGRNMIWTGTLIGAFLIYHLLHFTVQITNPSIAAARNADTLGRPDVFQMVVKSFQQAGIASLYLLSMIALGLHLLHGIQSSVQTWGLNNDRSLPLVEGTGRIAAAVLFLWYIAIPVVIVVGIVK